MARHRLVRRQFAAQPLELDVVGHGHVAAALRDAADRTGAHGEHHVAGLRDAADRVGHRRRCPRRTPARTCPRAHARARATRPSAASDRRFARGIDLGQQQHVGAGQHLHEILEQVARARVAVRLEGEHQAAARKGDARRLQRRRHLRRVMAVVVDQREAARTPFARRHLHVAVVLEAPADAAEFRERALDRVAGNLQFGGDRDRGERVQHVVPPGQIERRCRAAAARRSGAARTTRNRLCGPSCRSVARIIASSRRP